MDMSTRQDMSSYERGGGTMANAQEPKPSTTWLSTQDQGYQDRKMIKWLGLSYLTTWKRLKKIRPISHTL